ncbi:MAG TPA: TolC family protein [Oscillatoriaceae cyanobacterium]
MKRLLLAGGLALALTLPARAATVLTLDQALQAGLADNPKIETSRLDSDKAQLALSNAQWQRLSYAGDISLGDEYGAQGLLSSQSPSSANIPVVDGTLSLQVPLFTGFRISGQISQAQAGLDYARANADDVRQQTIYDITQAYWEARRAELHAQEQADSLAQAGRSRDSVQASYEIGRVAAHELDRAQVSYDNQQSATIQAQEDAADARDKLAALLHRDLTGVSLADPPTRAAPATRPVSTNAAIDPSQAIAQALRDRPDVRMAKAQVLMQESAVRVAEADRWPQISLVSSYQQGNNPYIPVEQYRSVLSGFEGAWESQLQLTYHFFDNGTISRNIATNQDQLAASKAALESVTRDAELAVRQALRHAALAQERLAIGTRGVALAHANFDWLSQRYKLGYALFVDLESARVDLETAVDQDVDARIDAALAKAELDRALGRLALPAPAGAAAPMHKETE